MCPMVARIACVLFFASQMASGQYTPVPLALDDDPAPGGIGNYENIDRPNISSTGILGFTADIEIVSDDEILVVDNVVIAREGDPAPGTTFNYGSFDEFLTYQHINAAGDVVYYVRLDIAPFDMDYGLYVNNTLMHREGDVLPAIPGRPVRDFEFLCLTDTGKLGYRVSLAGGTAVDDFALVFDGAVIAREGDLVGATGFAPTVSWGSGQFSEIDWNANGDVIFEGDTDVPDTTRDGGLFLKTVNGPMTLLIREGGTAITAPSGIETVTAFDQTRLTTNGKWSVTGEFGDSLTVTSSNDDVHIVDVGGGPVVVLQEGAAIPSIPGTVGGFATVGIITGGYVNGAGDALTLANIDDETGPSLTEGLFLNGVLIMTDRTPVPALGGQNLNGFATDRVLLAEDGRIFFEGDATSFARDGIFEAVAPGPAAVEGLSCSLGADTITATWTLPPAATYTAIRVSIDGVAQMPDLPGTATMYQTPVLAPGTHEIRVQGSDGVLLSPPRSCSETVVASAVQFVRGDTNGDMANNIADAVYLLGNLFPSGSPNVLACLEAADANNDGAVNIADAVAILGSLFGSPAVPLAAPYPTCGVIADSPNQTGIGCATGTCP